MLNISSNFQPTSSRLKELMDNLRYINSLPVKSRVDIKQIGFITPLSITPIAAVINEKKLTYNYDGKHNAYLKTVRFPAGMVSGEGVVANRTYLPIIKLELQNLKPSAVTSRLMKLHEIYLELLRNNIIIDKKFLNLITDNTFGFLLGELLDNVEQHSAARNVYIFAQYWPKINSCEICLLDDGVGLLGSLKKAGRSVGDHMGALSEILRTGLSAKNEFGDIKRGTGLRNTRLAITNKVLNGEFLVASGNVVFFQSAIGESKFGYLTDYEWQGTILMLRVNRPTSQFNLYDYVR